MRFIILSIFLLLAGCEFASNDKEPAGSSPIDDAIPSGASSVGKASASIGDTMDDELVDLAIDASNNVYVTGYVTRTTSGVTSKDVVVASYTTSGAQRWIKYLSTTSNEEANAITLDSSGNVYVTGYTYGDLEGETNAGNSDIFISRLDSSGNKKWTTLLGTKTASGGDPNPEIHEEEGNGIAIVDSQVWVVGSTFSNLAGKTNNGALDAFTAIYDIDNGTLLTLDLYGTAMSEVASRIVSNGTVTYIAGGARGDFNGQTIIGATDGYLISVQGTTTWTRFFGSTSFDGTWGLAVDASGNAYVAGHTEGLMNGSTESFGGDADAYVIKYSSSGTRLGVDVQGTSGTDSAEGVTVTPTGEIFGVGYTNGRVTYEGYTVSGTNIAVAKYTSNFAQDGSVIIGNDASSQVAHKTAADSVGDLWIVGKTTGTFEGITTKGGTDGFLLKISTSLASTSETTASATCLVVDSSKSQTLCYNFASFYSEKTDSASGTTLAKGTCDAYNSNASAKVTYTVSGGSCPSGAVKSCEIYMDPYPDKAYTISFIGSGFTASSIVCTRTGFGY